ncbi:MAG: hypothetical protein O3C43_05450 [Verrucomicrobia bacterium]|nr:hypothetical protein [Verrucomicrobiota bacterium]MDA1065929.1 hypothetical protein [Verrucomicrobiota bacterium]
MAKQLIFGSVPHGLQPGRSGYCLVAGHTDLPNSLIRQLEQETSVFPEGVEVVPPCHKTRMVGDKEWHLFIHQTINIKDYTGRLSGVTHVIAERADNFSTGTHSESFLNNFTGWITEIPKMPEVFGEEKEIDLGGFQRVRNDPPLKEAQPVGQSTGPTFRLDSTAETKRPVPRPRSGIYYERKPKRNRLGWWFAGGLLIVIIVFVITR